MQRWRASVDPAWSYEAWREQARAALLRDVPPENLDWPIDTPSNLFAAVPVLDADLDATPATSRTIRVPKQFAELAHAALCHCDNATPALLYRLLWRLQHGERLLLGNLTDSDVHRAQALVQSVRRDTHKMKAFVRFREVPGQENAFIAWFEPEHHIVDRVATFFAKRFAGMRWAILTPYRSVFWDGEALSFGPGATREDAPAEDARESLWQTYYANIFNPARLNTRMMQQEMAVKYWKNLPEAHLLPELVREAGKRVQEMHERQSQPPRRRIPGKAAVRTHAKAVEPIDSIADGTSDDSGPRTQ